MGPDSMKIGVVGPDGEVVDAGLRVRPWSCTACSEAMSMAVAVADLAGRGGGEAPTLDRAAVAIFSSECRGGALVGGQRRRGEDLVVEAGLVDGPQRPRGSGARRPPCRPADVPLLGDQLGAAELADLLGAVALSPAPPNPENGSVAEGPAAVAAAAIGIIDMFWTPPVMIGSLVPDA